MGSDTAIGNVKDSIQGLGVTGRRIALLLAWLLALAFLAQPSSARTDDGIVHAVLFYSPTCPHCHKVIDEDLPPLLEEYGQRFALVAVNTAHPGGQTLYQATIQRFNIPQERRGVPALVIGDHVLVGSLEIPQRLPGLIDAYLAEGGIGWPDIPGLAEALQSAEPTAEATVTPPQTNIPMEAGTATSAATPAASPTPSELAASVGGQSGSVGADDQIPEIMGTASDSAATRFRRDLVGNSLSLLVLVGMVGVALQTTVRFTRLPEATVAGSPSVDWRQGAVAALILLGIGVSAYMAYVETSQTTAVCGPVGDCNTVQQSEYARLLGIVPIGIVGMVGYAALGLTWVLGRVCPAKYGLWARLLLPLMALLGTFFSIYLTFLEPFVIGATCMWCLSSAVAITAILIMTADQGRRALAELRATGTVDRNLFDERREL